MAMVGVNAWGKIVFPSVERSDRTSDGIPSGFVSGYPQSGLSNDVAKIEANYGGGLWFVEEFAIPDIDKVESITLTYTRNGSDTGGLNLYLFNYDIPALNVPFKTNDETPDCQTYLSNVYTVIGSYPRTTSGTVNTPFKTIAAGTTMSVTLNSSDITTLKTIFGVTSGTLNLKLLGCSSSNSNKIALWSSSSSSLLYRRPRAEVVYNDAKPKIGETAYASFSAAFSAATAGNEIVLYDDVVLTERLSFTKNLTIKAAANRNVTIYRYFDNSGQALMIGDTNNLTLKFDGTETGASLTIDDNNINKGSLYSSNQTSTTITFDKVTFKNVSSAGEAVVKSANGVINLNDVTFEDCNPSTALMVSTSASNERLKLSGTMTITNSKETHISSKTRVYADGATFSPSETLNVSTEVAAGSSVVTFNTGYNASQQLSNFNVINDDLGLMQGGTNHTNELLAVQAYTLNVTSAGAATLVLPFESTIPTTVTGVYKLEYNSGDDINAIAETTSLAADKAVLVVATEGKHKFVRTTNGTAVSGSGQTSTYGVLIGNYDADTFYAPVNSYILTNHSGSVAFRKVTKADTNKVGAYRAYMSVAYVSSDPGSPKQAPALFTISFPGVDGTTDIKAVDRPIVEDGVIYNLQGVRMNSDNLPKGIYIKNGKKFVVK